MLESVNVDMLIGAGFGVVIGSLVTLIVIGPFSDAPESRERDDSAPQ